MSFETALGVLKRVLWLSFAEILFVTEENAYREEWCELMNNSRIMRKDKMGRGSVLGFRAPEKSFFMHLMKDLADEGIRR